MSDVWNCPWCGGEMTEAHPECVLACKEDADRITALETSLAYERALTDGAHRRARTAEAERDAAQARADALAKKLEAYEAREAASRARLHEHFRVKQQCNRCGYQSIDWLGENAACPYHACSGGMVALAQIGDKTDG